MTPEHFDVVVLGGGAGGLGAARAAAWDRAGVALISDAPLGGDCTWTGCVPSKTLIEAARQDLSFGEALARVKEVTHHIGATENAPVLRSEGVEVIEGRGRFVDSKTIEVATNSGHKRTVVGQSVIIATGSRAFVPAIAGLAGLPFLTNHDFFDQESLPDSLAVIGGGPVGCELGDAMARFGSQVTIIETADRVLPNFEPDASALVAEGLKSLGVRVLVGARAQSVAHDGDGFRIEVAGEVVRAQALLVAAGRTANVADMGLADIGVGVGADGFIETDRYLRTNVKGVFAVGDVNGKQLLSHAADEMGRSAAWTALRTGRRYPFVPERIPQVVFTTPELATVGVLEADSPKGSLVAEAPMAINDRALAAAQTEGFVRLISKPGRFTKHRAGGKLVGATIVGGHAGELINECALVMRTGSYAGRLAQTARAYPSWSTILQKAAARWFITLEGKGARPPRRS